MRREEHPGIGANAAVRHKIRGFWGTEDVRARVDFSSGAILSSTRTDIDYHWMN